MPNDHTPRSLYVVHLDTRSRGQNLKGNIKKNKKIKDLPDWMLQTVRAPDKSHRIGVWIPAISRIPTVRDRHVHGKRTEHAWQPDGAQDSTISLSVSGTGSLRETTRLQGQVTSPSLRSKAYAARVKTCARRNMHISILAAHDAPA